MYVPLLPILVIILAIALMAIIIWIAYSYSAAYQNTITMTLPMMDTSYYINGMQYPITSISLTISGKMKNKKTPQIIDSHKLQSNINEKLIVQYKDSIIIHEADIFRLSENNTFEGKKRHPIPKQPTLENLSIIFFKKMETFVNEMKQGALLVSVELISDNLRVTRSRYKINSYTL